MNYDSNLLLIMFIIFIILIHTQGEWITSKSLLFCLNIWLVVLIGYIFNNNIVKTILKRNNIWYPLIVLVVLRFGINMFLYISALTVVTKGTVQMNEYQRLKEDNLEDHEKNDAIIRLF